MSAQIGLFGVEPTSGGDRDCWATPSKLFDELNRKFNFTLDVCAHPWSAKCPQFYTPETNGLAQDWATDAVGSLFTIDQVAAWCNPPFSDARPWIAKARDESYRHLTTVVILPATRVEQDWWQECVEGCDICGTTHLAHRLCEYRHAYKPMAEVISLPGRVEFVPPPGVKSSGPGFPSCLAIFWGR